MISASSSSWDLSFTEVVVNRICSSFKQDDFPELLGSDHGSLTLFRSQLIYKENAQFRCMYTVFTPFAFHHIFVYLLAVDCFRLSAGS